MGTVCDTRASPRTHTQGGQEKERNGAVGPSVPPAQAAPLTKAGPVMAWKRGEKREERK